MKVEAQHRKSTSSILRKVIPVTGVLMLAGFLLFRSFDQSLVFAQEPTTGEFEEKDVTIVYQDQVIDKDYFAAGEVVEISGTVNGDVYVAGGQLLISGTVNGDVLAAGGTVTVTGEVAQNVRMVGGTLSVSGTVGRNISVAGGTISINKGAVINGNVTGAGGTIELLAPTTGSVAFAAGNLLLGNTVGGDMDVAVGTMRFLPEATVQGDLTYRSEDPVSFNESQIAGTVTKKDMPEHAKSMKFNGSGISESFAGFAVMFEIISFIAKLVVGLLFIHVFPRFSRATVETINRQPWKSFGVGILTFILTPFIIIALMVTVIGIPIAIMFGIGYVLGLYVAGVVAALAIGHLIARRFNLKWNDGWIFVAGLLVLYLLKIIPIFGWIAGCIAMLFGLGSLFVSKMEVYKEMRKKKLL